MYKDYKKARDAAWNVLIRYRVDRLPVEITKICAYEGLVLLPYSQVVSELKTFGLLEHSERTDGFSLLHQKYFFLFYDDIIRMCMKAIGFWMMRTLTGWP